MPNPVGPDGIAVSGYGWTNQSTQFNSNLTLETYPNSSAQLFDVPNQNSYGAWTMIPEDAITTNTHTSTQGYLMRFFVPANFSCGHLDMIFTAATAVTNAVAGIYSGSSFAVGPLVWTADFHASAAVGLVTATWNGASSPASVTLVGGNTYWVYYELTFTTSATLAGSSGASAASMNPNLTASATSANNAMVLTAAAPSSLTASTALTPQTSWANNQIKSWFGLRA